MNAAIAGMAALSVPAAEIAERLVLPLSAVRAALRSASESADENVGEETEQSEHSDGATESHEEYAA